MKARPKRPIIAAALLATCLAVTLPACKAPAPIPDFTTPIATLETFQSAFKADLPVLEYECFSLDFKEKQGGLDLDIYASMRNQAIDENPLAAALLSMKDLTKSVTEVAVDETRRMATMTLSILGEELLVIFVRETYYRLEYDENIRTVEDLMPPLFAGSIRTGPDTFELTFRNVPKKWLRNLPYIRRIVAEERWKFGEFFLLKEPGRE
jgi:hypothetical protein